MLNLITKSIFTRKANFHAIKGYGHALCTIQSIKHFKFFNTNFGAYISFLFYRTFDLQVFFLFSKQ